ncbi:mannitol repressor protein [Pasteurellaceae bacterium RH1A]|nr:mannitol repressor protein [Pasteurellaceae bacterium RH1A]
MKGLTVTYEKLEETTTLRGFIIASVAMFEGSVDELINRVFRKTDFAIKSVVDSLFESAGPLADLSIRLKVLLGLGVISHDVFYDISAFITLKQQLNNDEQEHSLSSELVQPFIEELRVVKDRSLFDLMPRLPLANQDSVVYQMKLARYEKAVRACLLLAIMDLQEALQIESPL